jgi:hypothetical protein
MSKIVLKINNYKIALALFLQIHFEITCWKCSYIDVWHCIKWKWLNENVQQQILPAAWGGNILGEWKHRGQFVRSPGPLDGSIRQMLLKMKLPRSPDGTTLR